MLLSVSTWAFGLALVAAVLQSVAPQDAFAGVKDAGMQNCQTMKEWRRDIFNTDVTEAPRLAEAVQLKNWRAVREEFLSMAKLPDHLDSSIRQRVLREMASAELFFASAGGDLKRMKQLLHEGADADAVSNRDENMTPLAWAADCDHPKAVGLLIAHGAQVDRKFGYGNDAGVIEQTTALSEASAWGARRAVAVLLAHHADVNAKVLSCAKYVVREDSSCVPGKVAVFNVLGVTSDPVVRRMLRAAGARKAIVGHFPPAPVDQ